MAQRGMTIVLKLSEKKALEKLKQKRKSNIGERANYILQLAVGKSVQEISEMFGRHAHTIRHWVKRYQTQGIMGLDNILPPGRPNNKTQLVVNELEKILLTSPNDYGYLQEGWSIPMLMDHFHKRHHAVISSRTLSRALGQTGYVYKRFSKRMPLNAPSKTEKERAVKTLLKSLKKDMKNKAVELFFEDESHFSNEPYVERGWFKRGEKKQSQHRRHGKG
jgi:transposase